MSTKISYSVSYNPRYHAQMAKAQKKARPSNRVIRATLPWLLVPLLALLATKYRGPICQTGHGQSIDQLASRLIGRSICPVNTIDLPSDGAQTTNIISDILDAPTTNLSHVQSSERFLKRLMAVLEMNDVSETDDDGLAAELAAETKDLVKEGIKAAEKHNELGPIYEYSSQMTRASLAHASSLMPLDARFGAKITGIHRARMYLRSLAKDWIPQRILNHPWFAPRSKPPSFPDQVTAHVKVTTESAERLLQLAESLGGAYMYVALDPERCEAVCKEWLSGVENGKAWPWAKGKGAMRKAICEKSDPPLCCRPVGEWVEELQDLTLKTEELVDAVDSEKERWTRLEKILIQAREESDRSIEATENDASLSEM
ncbi:hypothetical protein NU195Hw_g1880t1 [Hortaea werneckii]